MMRSPRKRVVQGPAARMRCRRCNRVFTIRQGHIIAHSRRPGALYVNCDGELVTDTLTEPVPEATAAPGPMDTGG